MKKLKLCPFCGGKAKLWSRKCSPCKYAIGCTTISCFVWIPNDTKLRELHNYTWCYVEKKSVIEEWNKRTK